MAFKISEKISIGASHFFTFHSENTALSIQKEIVERDNPYDVQLAWRTKFKYAFSTKGGMLTKFGIAADWRNVKLGATVTTTTYYHFQKKASYENSDLRVYGSDSTVLHSNLASANLFDFKTPWSVAIGADFKIARTRVSLSSEYFQSIKRYTIIDALDDPFNGLATGNHLERTTVQQENNAVLNMAIGLQTRLRHEQLLIMGFRTDFNQRAIDQKLQTLSFLSTTPSVFHFSFGGVFTMRNNRFSAGIDYSFGKKRTTGRLVDLTNITQDNLFAFSETGGIESRYQSIVFIFTYDFILKSWNDWRKRKQDLRDLGGQK